jgi:hypothetical protein
VRGGGERRQGDGGEDQGLGERVGGRTATVDECSPGIAVVVPRVDIAFIVELVHVRSIVYQRPSNGVWTCECGIQSSRSKPIGAR